MMDDAPRTSTANGTLWGHRARDWASIQEAQFAAGYEAALDKSLVGTGTCLLDAGCGAGMAASLAFRRGAAVSGIDASHELLEIARERVPDGAFHSGDLEELPFDDATFDVVTGFNSFQFAGNPVIALREARRVIRPSGYIVIMTWGEPDGMEAAAIVASLKPLLPPPPPGAPGPFALSDEAKLRAFAFDAGLVPIEVFDVECPWSYPDTATALRGLGSSGAAAKAIETSGADAVDGVHAVAIAPFQLSDGSYRIGATARVLIATTGK